MLEKTRKTPAKKKSPKPSARETASNAALPPAPQEHARALPPSPEARGGVTQGSPTVAAGKVASGTSAAPGQSAPKTPLTAEARWRMIAEAAYFKAQRRGFLGGDAKRDWAEAEAEIDTWLLESR